MIEAEEIVTTSPEFELHRGQSVVFDARLRAFINGEIRAFGRNLPAFSRAFMVRGAA